MPEMRLIGRVIQPAIALFAASTLIAGCSTSQTSDTSASSDVPSPSTSVNHGHNGTSTSVAVPALRSGERWIDVPMPGGTYRPQADAGGTDDYRCLLLDPKITVDSFLSGVVLEPGNPNLIHHAVLYQVDPDKVAAGKAKDVADPRPGWSCFGSAGLPSKSAALGGLDAIPWLAAWAASGGEQSFATGTGQKMKAGSRLILQMHYNLINGGGVDSTAVKLRVAASSARLQPLHTRLLPAPVELPCPASKSGSLCNRTASVLDVVRRFGEESGGFVPGLQLLCGGSPTKPKAGPTQSCAGEQTHTIQIRAVAGHMHLLGKSIQIDLERKDKSNQRLLDIKVWNFDDQRAIVLAKPVMVHPGDKLRVTCTHDATLRDKLPALAKLPPRYVVWGAGSSDEMCLGIVSYTES
jgi:hypothetical protein